MFSPAQLSWQFAVPGSGSRLNFGRSFGTLLIVGRSGSSVYLFGFGSVMAIPSAVSASFECQPSAVSLRLRFSSALSAVRLKLNYLE